ncbi:PREDICTED: protein POLLEN DEFECTIVE IN GUIDANCE 1-like isoform X2 [Nelumbo nucifera]|uniref:Protein POLLEN DEFECTIVE IN GUIDANCE 1-like isoform X2 n=1 Tax=Nelumbo nucifera TaxID=4432 RepID=A0A1U8BP41_NELNU|nr:PREDICTED: protein POLLEN DEFECTIVE IN GUIDANCE 1-like isoform X2 [Nelumbo nucifera]
MALRSGGRKLSFDILRSDGSINDEFPFYRSNSAPGRADSGDVGRVDPAGKTNRRKRKNKGSKKKKKVDIDSPIDEDQIIDKSVDSVFDDRKPSFYENASFENGMESDHRSYTIQTVVCEEITVPEENATSIRTLHQVDEHDFQNLHGESHQPGEFRQRSVNGCCLCDDSLSPADGPAKVESNVGLNSSLGQWSTQPNGSVVTRKLETSESLDWKKLMAEDPNYLFSVEKSPVKFFMGEMHSGNSLHSTTTIGNEKEREIVYDTIFRLPWRCELLVNVGFFVCLDSFLSLLTITPARLLMTLRRFLNGGLFQRPSASELSDFGCFIVLVLGVTLLQETDISLIYHMIRGQGTVKLYVVYNVLEIFDRIFQNFGGDILQTLFSSAEGLASSSPENMSFWLWRFISDEALAIFASIGHSFILLAQAITFSTCIVAHNNALLALLVSNNFAEIKSNVFKRFSKDNIHSLVYSDSVERFHISSFLLFVLAQNILEAEGPWLGNFLSNALLVYICEMSVDIIKHSFVAKFNEIKPIAFSEFLEDLCKQVLKFTPEDRKKNLTFVPLAPACVVIRMLTPVYGVHLPYAPFLWRLFWIFLLSTTTYIMLASLKVLIGMGLQRFAICKG